MKKVILIVMSLIVMASLILGCVSTTGQAKGGKKGGGDNDPVTVQCSDQADNDGDGACDFEGCNIGRGKNRIRMPADPDCDSAEDDNETSGGLESYCGDQICDVGEECNNCELDCGPCPPICGDGNCDEEEDCNNCEADCLDTGQICCDGVAYTGDCCDGNCTPSPGGELGENLFVSGLRDFDADIDDNKVFWIDVSLSGHENLYMHDLLTGTTKQITDNPSNQEFLFVFENRVYYLDDKGGDDDIYMLDLTTDIESAVLIEPDDQMKVRRSGSNIVYSNLRGGIFLFNLDSGVKTPIAQDLGRQQFDPYIFGDWIVFLVDTTADPDSYSIDNQDVYAYNIVTSQVKPLTETPHIELLYSVYDNMVSFTQTVSTGGSPEIHVYMYDLVDDTEIPASSFDYRSEGPGYFTDGGTKILWKSNWDFSIYAYDIATQEQIPVSNGGTQYVYDYDGSRVVWVSSGDVMMYDFNTQETTTISCNEYNAKSPLIEGDYVIIPYDLLDGAGYEYGLFKYDVVQEQTCLNFVIP